MSSLSKEFFNKYRGRAKKEFGQNFIFDQAINAKIVNAAPNLSNKNVLEIGPGPGGLTFEILSRKPKHFFVIEYDDHWANAWTEHSAEQNFENFSVIHNDALKFDFDSLDIDMIISNLPYNISTQILFKFLPKISKYDSLILMFQKEVADRLYAKPKAKSYAKLSVLSQSVAEVKKMFDLEPGSFFPAPKVRSTVVKFIPKENINLDFDFLAEVTTELFKHRRKVVSKALKKFHPNPQEFLQKIGYDKDTRAEEICVEDYIKICRLLKNDCFQN